MERERERGREKEGVRAYICDYWSYERVSLQDHFVGVAEKCLVFHKIIVTYNYITNEGRGGEGGGE